MIAASAPAAFAATMRERAAADTAAIGATDAGGSHTWADLVRRSAHLARRLPSGRRIAVLVPQSAGALAVLAACDRAAVEALVISAIYGRDRARRHAAAAGAHVLIACDDGDLEIERLGEGVRAAGSSLLVLTSGTSGSPKCARHIWPTLAATVRRTRHHAGMRVFCGHPLAQFGGLQVVAQAVFGGGVLYVPPDFSPSTALALLERHGADCLCGTPSYVRHLLLAGGADVLRRACVRRVTLGGEIADQPLLEAIRQALPDAAVVHIYASTELGAIVAVRDGRAGFDASLLDGERLRLVDGVIHARRAPQAMVGYADRSPGSADEWVSTGDLAEVVDGRVLFRGRTSDVFSVGGSKVNPIEVEAVVRDVPGVLDVVVGGHRSSILGALPKAIVRADATMDRAALERAVIERCAARLPPHMVPRLLEFRDTIETSECQKVQRRES